MDHPNTIVFLTPAEDQDQVPALDLDRSIFVIVTYRSVEELSTRLGDVKPNLLLFDRRASDSPGDEVYESLKQFSSVHNLPLILLADNLSIEQKISALDFGFDDVLLADESAESATVRLLNQIYHRIANAQLKNTLELANQAAFSAMKESSNLGRNVQFLLQTYQCTNMDQLGQAFFRVISQYRLNCSLQLRSRFGVKNMEANGMSRPLEAELLTQLKDTGRYYDFGHRSVMNYGTVSVLIKNMPENEHDYGMVKDNTFTLLQGLDARVRSLDEHQQLAQEKEALQQLSNSVRQVALGIEVEYHSVMKRIVDVVEDAAEAIDIRIPTLLLNEDQEHFIAGTMQRCVDSANRVFAEGLRVDKHFQILIDKLDDAVASIEVEHVEPPFDDSHDDASDDVELF